MTTPASLDDVLARHRVGISSDEFVADLDDALSAVSQPTAEPLSASEVAFLRSQGGVRMREVLDGDADEAARPLSQGVTRETAQALAATTSIVEAALQLAVDRSRISQLLSRKRLWAFQFGRSKRIPRWQFAERGLLPGLDQVVLAIPDGLAPASVEGFMTTPQPELGDVAPVAFLRQGGDPRAVCELLADLGRW